jgi:hypothetical protein
LDWVALLRTRLARQGRSGANTTALKASERWPLSPVAAALLVDNVCLNATARLQLQQSDK